MLLETGAGTVFRQNGKNTHWKDSGDVVCCNKQGNCIDSFRLIGFGSRFPL